jgi:hypothetical protein
MKYLNTYEKKFFDRTITDGIFTIGDLVYVEDWANAKIIKVYQINCLVEFFDGFSTTIKKEELRFLTPEEIEQHNLEQTTKKYNL